MNYQISTTLYDYFNELDPAKRKDLLLAAKSELAGEEDLFEAAQMLYDARYKGDGAADRFIWNCINLIIVYKSSGFFAKKNRKEALEAMKEMNADVVEKYGDTGRNVSYWEMRNAVRRYFSTTNSKGYARKVFGIVSANDSDRLRQSTIDAYAMSLGLARKYDLADEMKVFCDAVRDEYATVDDKASERLDEYAAGRVEKDVKKNRR